MKLFGVEKFPTFIVLPGGDAPGKVYDGMYQMDISLGSYTQFRAGAMKIDALIKFVGHVAPAKKAETKKESKKESKGTKKESEKTEKKAKKEEKEKERSAENTPPAPRETPKGKLYLCTITMSLSNIHFSGTRYPRAHQRSYSYLNLPWP